MTRVQPNPLVDQVRAQAMRSLNTVERHFRTQFGRNGFDGKGGHLALTVGLRKDYISPASSTGSHIEFAADPAWKDKPFRSLAYAVDMVAHEFTHAVLTSAGYSTSTVINTPTGTTSTTSWERQVVHESFADVLGTSIDPQDWLVGEDVLSDVPELLRDLRRPAYSTVAELMTAHEKKFVDAHTASGVLSLAAVNAADALGSGGRDAVSGIWYLAATKYLPGTDGLAGAATATLSAARDRFGAGSREFSAVASAWQGVGLAT